MTQSTTNFTGSTTFREADEIVDLGERRVTLWAIGAFLLGLASILALVAPLLWVLPCVAILSGLIALRIVQRHHETVSGRGLAVVGMGLASLFLCWAITSQQVRVRLLDAQARIVGQKWLELIQQQRLEEAHQLKLPYTKRVSPKVRLEDHYRDPRIKEAFTNFATDPVVTTIVLLGDDARISFHSFLYSKQTDSMTDNVVLRFLMESASGKSPPQLVDLEMERVSFGELKESRWTVLGAELRRDAS